VILSDRDLRQQIKDGRLVIEPFDESAIQPSSIDLRCDNLFRVFANHRQPYIDPKKPVEDLTELVEASEEHPFILHPGEFVLASTREVVTLPNDLVARLEGKSSLGRIGLLIHSSLPGSEPVMLLHQGTMRPTPIEHIVRKKLQGSIAGFDPETFEIGYHEITGWYEGPADRIFEVVLASGRRVRVTAGHNLFTLDRDGRIAKVRTGELRPGMRVAVPRRIPDPSAAEPVIDILGLAPESAYDWLTIEGPSVARAFAEGWPDVSDALRLSGRKHVGFYRSRRRLPLSAARTIPGLCEGLNDDDRVGVRGSARTLPPRLAVDTELAWLLGLFVADGYRRRHHIVVSNTDEVILARAAAVFAALGFPVTHADGRSVTCSSVLLSSIFEWLGVGPGALGKRIPGIVFGWPRALLEAFFEGLIDGDGSRQDTRDSYWSSSDGLTGDVMMLAARLSRRASVCYRDRNGRPAYQVSIPHREHKLLTAVPLPDRLLVELRETTGMTQLDVSKAIGFRTGAGLNNLERSLQRDAVRLATLRRLHRFYAPRRETTEALPRLSRLVEGDLAWDEVREVRDTGTTEPIFDIEVRPGGHKIENFLAGHGGVLVSNTAGFVDAGWSGHLTLELSNVANLPIAIYPGMKIGQLCVFQMSSPAERPYSQTGKYQGQRGPTPSRIHMDFDEE